MPKTTPPAKKSLPQPPVKAQLKAPATVKPAVPAKPAVKLPPTDKPKPSVKQPLPNKPRPSTKLPSTDNPKAPVRQFKVNSYIIWAIVIITAVLAYTMIWVSYWYKSGLEELNSSSAIIKYNSNTNQTVSNTNSLNTNIDHFSNTNSGTNVNGTIVPPTTSWSSYENTLYGYELKYPNTWADENTSVSNPAMFADPEAVAQEIVTELLQGTKVEVYAETSSAATVADAVQSKDTEWTVLQEIRTTVDNTAAVRRQVQAQSFTNITYVLKNNMLYSIIQYIPKPADRGKYTAIYDQILANFTFSQ